MLSKCHQLPLPLPLSSSFLGSPHPVGPRHESTSREMAVVSIAVLERRPDGSIKEKEERGPPFKGYSDPLSPKVPPLEDLEYLCPTVLSS